MDTTKLYDADTTAAMEEPRTNFTSTNMLNTDFQEEHNHLLAPVVAVCALVMVVGVVGNILIIYIVGRTYKHTAHRLFILNLAYFDTVACCIAMPFIITHTWLWPNFKLVASCKTVAFVTRYVSHGSFATLLVIAFERYRMICKPLSKQISVKMAKRICIVISVPISGVPSILGPIMLTMRQTHHNRTDVLYNQTLVYYRCSIDEAFDNTPYPNLWNFYLVVFVAVFMIAMAVMYGSILMKIRKSIQLLKNMRNNYTSSMSVISNTRPQFAPAQAVSISDSKDVHANCSQIPSKKRQHQERQILKLSLSLTFLFLLSYVPYMSLRMVIVLHPDYLTNLRSLPRIIFGFLYQSYIWNYVGNLFIYAFFDKHFRKRLKYMFICRKQNFNF